MSCGCSGILDTTGSDCCSIKSTIRLNSVRVNLVEVSVPVASAAMKGRLIFWSMTKVHIRSLDTSATAAAPADLCAGPYRCPSKMISHQFAILSSKSSPPRNVLPDVEAPQRRRHIWDRNVKRATAGSCPQYARQHCTPQPQAGPPRWLIDGSLIR
jgi:hypothetical protein